MEETTIYRQRRQVDAQDSEVDPTPRTIRRQTTPFRSIVAETRKQSVAFGGRRVWVKGRTMRIQFVSLGQRLRVGRCEIR